MPDAGHEGSRPGGSLEMPAPTVWPMLLALGLMLLAGGLLLEYAYSALGALVAVTALTGWIRQLLPGAGTIREPLEPPARRGTVVAPQVAPAVAPAVPAARQMYPETVHPYSAGLKGGIAGGVVMAVAAIGYGLVSGRGIWFPINLLAAMALPRFQHATLADLETFSLAGLLVATTIHAVASLLVGLSLAVLFPALPRWPVFWGGVAAPLLWTGLVYGLMEVLDPDMAKYVSWPWFAGSQFGYGIVASLVIQRSEERPVRRRGERTS
jgi:hypothetical protein